MARILRSEHGVTSPLIPLHDRPMGNFKPLSSELRSSFLSHHPELFPNASAILSGKTRLIVSSTSWTVDEDFSLLLAALQEYASIAQSRAQESGSLHLPNLLVVITGKGPQKALYESQISHLETEKKLHCVQIKTAWLSVQDYANLLGSADLGVCLHTSSSGLDLPMKVVDMFGAGLPVVGWSSYETWNELVQEGHNGRGFSDSLQLTSILIELFGTPDNIQLKRLKDGALHEGGRRWDDEWDSVAGQLLGYITDQTP
ncbi:MAG: mannosyltransferase [Trizodia sp. TS-e1964]|nr:MAG: mannosyltransferase [Trizodia sp. TS-e1964]